MNISFSLPTSIDATGILRGLSGEKAAETGASEGSDGFAELLNSLAAIVPASLVASSAGEDRQNGELPTGKNLPAALQALPEDVSEAPADRTPEAELSAVLSLLQVPGPIARLPVPTPANSNPIASEARASPQPAVTANLLDPVPNAHPSAIRSLPTPPATPLEAAISSMGKGAEVASARKGGELQVRISSAARPVEAGVAFPIQPALAESARGERPPAAIDGAPLANAALVLKQAPASTEARQSTATVALSSQPSEGDTGSDVAHQPSNDAGTAEHSATAPRAANNVDTAKAAPIFAAQIDDAAPALSPVASTPRPLATDPFADVERVVEHLMAARQTDLSKPAAIAVAHREFGALTVTFAPAADGMNVEIAAETNESQRALAAAMAQDRSIVRAQDTAPQPTAQQNQPAPHAQDRSASGSQNGAGFAQGQGSHQSQGDNPRSQNSDQRGRHGGTATPGNPNTARPSSDDALYA